MKNTFLRINQIKNAPNIPYYQDTRILKIVVSPSERYQYAKLSGLETLYTNQTFNLQYNESNSVLTLILTETKPNNFDIAYAIVLLEKFPENSLVQETHVMQTMISGIVSPLITFELQITSETIKPSNNIPKKMYPTLKNIESNNCNQIPYIPNQLDFSAIFRINEHFESKMSDILFTQNIETNNSSSDYEEEEDMLINARIFFNDETISLLKRLQQEVESPILKSQQQKNHNHNNSINQYKDNHTENHDFYLPEAKKSKPSNNENNSIPFIPPDENDAPFLLPKSNPNEHQPQNTSPKKNQPINYNINENQYPHQNQQQQRLSNPQSPQNYTYQSNYYPTNYQYLQYPPNQNH